MNKSYRTIGIGVVGLLLAGAGSAALVDFFGTSSGTAQVNNQALSVTGDLSPSKTVQASPAITADSFTVTNNNGNNEVSYKIDATQSANGDSSNVNDFRTTVIEVEEDVDTGGAIVATRNFDTSTDRITLNVSSLSGESGAVYFDRDGDDVPEFQLGFQTTEGTTGGSATLFKNVGGTYEEDTAFNRQDNTPVYGDNPTTSDDRLGSIPDAVDGEIGKDSIVLEVDVSRLGSSFQYGVKDNGGGNLAFVGGNTGFDASDDEATESGSIGTQAVQVSSSSSTATSNALSILGSDAQGPERFAIINEYGSATPVDTYTVDVGVAPN